jgi:hypothetical protein
MDASCISYSWAVDAALTAGASADEIMGTLIAVAPITGLARVVAAAPEVAHSLGYDIDQAFEGLDRDPRLSYEGSVTVAKQGGSALEWSGDGQPKGWAGRPPEPRLARRP